MDGGRPEESGRVRTSKGSQSFGIRVPASGTVTVTVRGVATTVRAVSMEIRSILDRSDLDLTSELGDGADDDHRNTSLTNGKTLRL